MLPFVPVPVPSPRPDPMPAENPLFSLWRAFWLDLPLAWAGEIDRFLFRWMEPPRTGEAAADPASSPRPDRPVTAADAVALGLGCGDYADEALPGPR